MEEACTTLSLVFHQPQAVAKVATCIVISGSVLRSACSQAKHAGHRKKLHQIKAFDSIIEASLKQLLSLQDFDVT